MPVIQFGTTSKGVVFTPPNYYPQSVSTNFSSVVSMVTRISGSDGGFDEFRGARAPREVGFVRQMMRLVSTSAQGLHDLVDNLRALARLGTSLLFYELPNGTRRWCYARLRDVQLEDTPTAWTGRSLEVTIEWDVPDPRWYEVGNTIFVGDGGLVETTSLETVTGAVSADLESDDTLVLHNTGNAHTPVVLTLRNQSGSAITLAELAAVAYGVPAQLAAQYGYNFAGLVIELLDENEQVVEGWVLTQALADGEQIIINTPAGKITYCSIAGDLSGLPYVQAYYGNGLVFLPPGKHTLKLRGGFTGTLHVTAEFWSAWY